MKTKQIQDQLKTEKNASVVDKVRSTMILSS